MKKEWIVLTFVLFTLILTNLASASLGMYPAKKEFYFTPNEQIKVTYHVYSDKANNNIAISAEGDLTQYVTFDKQSLIGGGDVTATVNLPASIDKPGKNQLYIVAAEQPVEGTFIGTSIRLRALINVYIPYPGKYIEANLDTPNANLGEKVPVELKVASRGTETITVSPQIYFYDSSGINVKTMSFSPALLSTNEEKYFRQYLDSSDLNPDDYLAKAIIDYGAADNMVLNQTFRIGNLRVDVVNFTQNLSAGEINKFVVRVKSNWNGKIEEVYADVKLLLNESEGISFRTPSIDLNPWEEKDIIGYFDTTGLKSKDYLTEIKLSYLGQTTHTSGIVWIMEKGINEITVIIIAVIVAIISIYYISKRLQKSKLKR